MPSTNTPPRSVPSLCTSVHQFFRVCSVRRGRRWRRVLVLRRGSRRGARLTLHDAFVNGHRLLLRKRRSLGNEIYRLSLQFTTIAAVPEVLGCSPCVLQTLPCAYPGTGFQVLSGLNSIIALTAQRCPCRGSS